jgi:uncharacterized protein YfbU (UPF0304 family)
MATKLKLSLVERGILANQLRILELLDKGEAKYYAHVRDAITSGYELDYAELTTTFSDPGLTEAECNEVYEILEMHRALFYSHEDLKDKAGIDADDLRFGGFDGNEESKQLAYYRFIKEEDKYGELTPPDKGNSHYPTLGRYRRMLRAFKEIQGSQGYRALSAEEIKKVIAAGTSKTQ